MLSEGMIGQGFLPLQDLDDPTFDPFANEELSFGTVLDPYARIHELAAENWVYHGEYRMLFMDAPNAVFSGTSFDRYTVFGYDKCAELIPKTEVFSSTSAKYTFGTAFGQTISGMDAPEHPRYRRIFQKAFLPQTVRHWGDALVQPVVEELLSKVKSKGRCDLVEDFTLHYPFHVIYRQLNLPAEDVRLFHKLAVAQTTYHYAPEVAVEAGRKLGDYFAPMVRYRRENPSDDLVSALALAEVDGERLPEDVVVSFFRQLVNAAGDTTYRATSTLLVGLLTNPDQLEAVRSDRSLVSAAIEEALRWDAPVISANRITLQELTVDGFTFPKNAWVELVHGSANRDPTKFVDPDRYNLFRSRDVRHLAFATGPHVCIGQHLARVEMERALNSILDMLPNLRLDPDMPPPEIRGFNLRAPRHIHVLFD